jgi:hypothetical protein
MSSGLQPCLLALPELSFMTNYSHTNDHLAHSSSTEHGRMEHWARAHGHINHASRITAQMIMIIITASHCRQALHHAPHYLT